MKIYIPVIDLTHMKGCNEKHGCTFLSYKVYSGIVMQKNSIRQRQISFPSVCIIDALEYT